MYIFAARIYIFVIFRKFKILYAFHCKHIICFKRKNFIFMVFLNCKFMEVTATKAMQLLSCVSCLKRALFHDGPTQKNVMQFVIKYNITKICMIMAVYVHHKHTVSSIKFSNTFEVATAYV